MNHNNKDEKKPSRSAKGTAGGYNAGQIQVLKGLEGVRKRPGMYIGGTGKQPLHHMIHEIVDNSVDEALAGHCSRIVVTLLPEGVAQIEDNGRGIPCDMNQQEGKTGLELAMTILHAGGKFDQSNYKTAGGLHGVGLSVVNALSSRMVATVDRDGKRHVLVCEQGIPTGPLKVVGKSKERGTTIWFQADRGIFEAPVEWDYEYVQERLREKAYLTSGLEIQLRQADAEGNVTREDRFCFQNGLAEMVAYLNEGRTPAHREVLHLREEVEGAYVELAIQYQMGEEETFRSFVNNIPTPLGGTHETGFRAAMTNVLTTLYGEIAKGEEKKYEVRGDDFREGMTAVLSIRIREPQFEGQTKDRLQNSEVRGIVQSFVTERLRQSLASDKKAARAIVEKAALAARARIAQKKARERARAEKSMLEAGVLPGKLSDCASNDTERTELFIVEGDSAGGSAKQGRDRVFQAILPLKGKILNVEKAKMNKVLDNDEIAAIITALGCGFQHTLDLENLRYGKIILMTDADVDGSHIRTLLLTLFYRKFPDMIERGSVFIARPPLYRLRRRGEERYVYSDEERDEVMEGWKGEGKVEIQRYKGLGELNPEQLWVTTMDPERRTLFRVRLDDAKEADETFQMLMGNDVVPRKRWIMENANLAGLEL